MKGDQNTSVRIVDSANFEWVDHKRFIGISIKPLLTPIDNPFANVNLVRVPMGGLISNHKHDSQIETVYILRGISVLRFTDQQFSFEQGSIVALPAGLEHELENTGDETVELLTFFTPPLA
jgi:quercetin dioxygenase-like cupin family protein